MDARASTADAKFVHITLVLVMVMVIKIRSGRSR
jgi:hypothetical protein